MENNLQHVNSIPQPVEERPKPRLRWTAELHEQFVEAVDQLGGKEVAKPKAIKNLMNSSEVSLKQLKSHLQKYRLGQPMGRLWKNKSGCGNRRKATALALTPPVGEGCSTSATTDVNKRELEGSRADQEEDGNQPLQVEKEDEVEMHEGSKVKHWIDLNKVVDDEETTFDLNELPKC